MTDPSEKDETGTYLCDDDVDNDGDGGVDFGPGCTAIGGTDCGCESAVDPSERDETGV